MDETVNMVMGKVEGIKGTVGEIKEKVFVQKLHQRIVFYKKKRLLLKNVFLSTHLIIGMLPHNLFRNIG